MTHFKMSPNTLRSRALKTQRTILVSAKIFACICECKARKKFVPYSKNKNGARRFVAECRKRGRRVILTLSHGWVQRATARLNGHHALKSQTHLTPKGTA